jgi:hypothetical protein
VLIGVVAALHPAGLVRSVRAATVDRRVLALVELAVVPAVVYAATRFGLQLGAVDEHAEFGHYAGMAAYAAVVRWTASPLGRTTVRNPPLSGGPAFDAAIVHRNDDSLTAPCHGDRPADSPVRRSSNPVGGYLIPIPHLICD